MDHQLSTYFSISPSLLRELGAEPPPVLHKSDDEMIARVVRHIQTRSHVLLTGTRGGGKSYVAEHAIDSSIDKKIIGGVLFDQGNRSKPTELLFGYRWQPLTRGRAGWKKLLPVVLKSQNRSAPPLTPTPQYAGELPTTYADRQAIVAKLARHWPAIPSELVRKSNGYAEDLDGETRARQEIDNPRRLWRNEDWWCLYLDEANRHNSQTLDSLLSMLEEGKFAIGGKTYFIPVILVLTANPPGYDESASQLSPPLESRLFASYRMQNPDLDSSIKWCVEKLEQHWLPRLNIPNTFDKDCIASNSALMRLAAGAQLCLWGDPTNMACKGHYYLDEPTRQLIARAANVDPELGKLMRELNDLSLFGPDGRSLQAWIGAALSEAVANNLHQVSEKELIRTAVAALAHRNRAKFSRGASPDRDDRLNRLSHKIICACLTSPEARKVFIDANIFVHDWLEPRIIQHLAKRKVNSSSQFPELEASAKEEFRSELETLAELIMRTPRDDKQNDHLLSILPRWIEYLKERGSVTQRGDFIDPRLSFGVANWLETCVGAPKLASCQEFQCIDYEAWSAKLFANRQDSILAPYRKGLAGAISIKCKARPFSVQIRSFTTYWQEVELLLTLLSSEELHIQLQERVAGASIVRLASAIDTNGALTEESVQLAVEWLNDSFAAARMGFKAKYRQRVAALQQILSARQTFLTAILEDGIRSKQVLSPAAIDLARAMASQLATQPVCDQALKAYLNAIENVVDMIIKNTIGDPLASIAPIIRQLADAISEDGAEAISSKRTKRTGRATKTIAQRAIDTVSTIGNALVDDPAKGSVHRFVPASKNECISLAKTWLENGLAKLAIFYGDARVNHVRVLIINCNISSPVQPQGT